MTATTVRKTVLHFVHLGSECDKPSRFIEKMCILACDRLLRYCIKNLPVGKSDRKEALLIIWNHGNDVKNEFVSGILC